MLQTKHVVPLLPCASLKERSYVTGRLVRILFLYLLLAATGLYLIQTGQLLWVRLFGLGLLFPGAGFLAHADINGISGMLHIAYTLCALAGFSCAIILWFATGNVLAPFFSWLLFAILAASMTHSHHFWEASPWLALGSVILLFATGALYYHICRYYALRKQRTLNTYLARESQIIIQEKLFSPDTHMPELSLEEVQRSRFLYDRALQPTENFDGFEWLDQFQTAAIRYQLNFLGYALAMSHYTHTPACLGYHQEAMRRLILKLQDYRIWRYWTLENLWGNMRYNPDPVYRENIMFTGFVTIQMAMYYAATGSREFYEAGSFSLNHPSGKSWRHDFPSLLAGLQEKMEQSPCHLIACEPNWIYPLCNMIGASAIKAHAPEIWQRHMPRFRQSLETNFMDPTGRIIACRSAYTGLAFPMIGGIMPQAMPCFFLDWLMPDIALRQWLLLRRTLLQGNRFNPDLFWRIDTGNYRRSRAAAYAATALAAAEMGDSDIYHYCMMHLEEECPATTLHNRSYRPAASVWAHAVEYLARTTGTHSFCHMLATPLNTQKHPHLTGITYPDILVAAAHYHDNTLRLILYTGQPEKQYHELHFAGLVPHTSYNLRMKHFSLELTSDANGTAKADIILDGRTEVILY